MKEGREGGSGNENEESEEVNRAERSKEWKPSWLKTDLQSNLTYKQTYRPFKIIQTGSAQETKLIRLLIDFSDEGHLRKQIKS